MFDVVVVGSGITGLSSAVALAERGARVAVLDRAPALGAAASGAPTGMLLPPVGKLAGQPLGQLCIASAAMWSAWSSALSAQTGLPMGYQPSPVLRLHRQTPHRLHPGETWITGDALAKAVRLGDPTAWAGAVVRPPAAHVHTRQVLRALLVRLRALGGVVSWSGVRGLLGSNGTVTGVCTERGHNVRAGEVLVAAGLATRTILASLDVELPIRGDSGQVVGVRPPYPPQPILLVEETYLVTKPGGLVIVGGVHTPGEERRIDPMATLELLRCAADVLGPLKAVAGAWCGVRPRASGGLPLLGAIPGWSRLSIAVGHGSNGFLLAPITAQAIATQIATGQVLPIAEACDPQRRMKTPKYATESTVARRTA